MTADEIRQDVSVEVAGDKIKVSGPTYVNMVSYGSAEGHLSWPGDGRLYWEGTVPEGAGVMVLVDGALVGFVNHEGRLDC